ncbi:MAG: twin-arginine translocase subunit TatC [Pseudomonadota bacterium]
MTNQDPTSNSDRAQNEGPDPKQQSYISHLIELRGRLLRALAALFILLLALMPFSNYLYAWLAAPLMAHLPGETSMIATQVASPFLAPFKLTLFVSFLIGAPYIFYQVWAFVAPGLYLHERRLVLPLMISSTLLFYLGIVFAYFVVFPLVFGFFTAVAPEGVTIMTDISHYLDFVLKLFFAFGAAFEVPVATYLVVRTGITTVDDLSKKRPYLIVAAFTVGMLLTPPDVVSQTLLAIPVWILYELGLLLCRMTNTTGEEDLDDEEREVGQPASD